VKIVFCADLLRLWSPSAYWKACELNKAGHMASHKQQNLPHSSFWPIKELCWEKGLCIFKNVSVVGSVI